MSNPTRLTTITVLYDANCPLCTAFKGWLEKQPCILTLHLVPAGSQQARDLFPDLDHARTLREITVVGNDGAVWTREYAWVMALWATLNHRTLAERLARPAWLPLARGAALTAAGLRNLLANGGGYPDPRVAATC